MKKLRQAGGFTLLEVLIVVAIIIIIAGIALPRFLGVSEQGRKARSAGDLRVLQTAIESYALNTNFAPGAVSKTAYEALVAASPQIISSANDFVDQFHETAGTNYEIKSEKTAAGKVYYIAGSAGPDGKVLLTLAAGAATCAKDDIVVTNAVLTRDSK